MRTVMTPEECQTWSQYLQLSKETAGLITAIRSSPPVRRVRGRTTNVTGRYPRPKMGRSIQFESEHVEFWAIYGMERDDAVLEFYDQSSRIPLSYRASSGHKTAGKSGSLHRCSTHSPFPCPLGISRRALGNGAAHQGRRMPRSSG